MSTDRPPGTERDEPPFVIGLLMGGVAQAHDALRRAVLSIDRRTQMFLWGASTVATFVIILILSIVDSPTLGGIFRGIFAGLFLALLFGVGVGWLLISTTSGRSRRPEKATAAGALDTLLAPTLRELSVVRADVIRKVKERSKVRVPLGVAAALGLWMLAQSNDDPPGFLGLIFWLVGGAIAGEAWAAGKLDREYRRLYKNRVLPLLTARFGDLTYREATQDDVQKLRVHRILPECDSIKAEDEIAGTHRGLSLSIVEARLERRSGKKRQVVFDGLLIELALPRSLTGTTVVLTDEGMFGNLKTRWRSDGMETVRLEDPRFEQRFEVYGNDQIESRALLTPAFMERFMALAAGSGFSLPGALAEGNRLMVALPKRFGGNLFEPPVYWKPAGGQALLSLEADIRAVLRMADTVIDLDFWAAGRKRDSIEAV